MFNNVEDFDRFITIRQFYNDKYELAIDLRAIEDNSRHGAGKKVINTQSGILLKITKLSTMVDVKCRIYVLSNGLVNFVSNNLQHNSHNALSYLGYSGRYHNFSLFVLSQKLNCISTGIRDNATRVVFFNISILRYKKRRIRS